MKKILSTLAILLLIPASSQAAEKVAATEVPSGEYVLDKSHASLIWKVSHLGLSDYTARFTDFDATIDFNSQDPTKSKLTVEVNPLSVETDYPYEEEKDFDKKLAESESWFNSSEFPKITFESKKIEKTGDDTGIIHGHLTMLGETKPLKLKVTSNGGYLKKPFAEVPALGFSATATMKRSDWGFDTYVPTIGDEVKILIEVEFHKDQEKPEKE